ncbi:hypothetical protein ACVWYH_010414 [Bradyrhizobium sp. GM24.11]
MIDIYPTVPEDIGQAVKIGRTMQTFLLETSEKVESGSTPIELLAELDANRRSSTESGSR